MPKMTNIDEAEEQADLSLSQLFAETASLRAQGGILIAYGLGELNPTRRSYRPKGHEGHAVPHGCQWARTCDKCPKHDCVIPANATPLKYDSPQAVKIRTEAAMEIRDKPVREVAFMVGISAKRARRIRRGCSLWR